MKYLTLLMLSMLLQQSQVIGFIRSRFNQTKRPRSRIELHIHLRGSVRVSTISELAKAKGHKIGQRSSYGDVLDAVSMNDQDTMHSFFSKLRVYLPLLIGDKAAIERIAYELGEDEAQEGVLYFETRYAPHSLSSSTLSPEAVVLAVNRGLARAEKDFGIVARSILCLHARRPEWSQEVLELAVKYRDSGVVGIDVAGSENSHGHSSPWGPSIVQAFQLAHELNIHRTVHAGETGSAKNVETAVEVLRAERIGHGYHVVENATIYEKCKEKKVHFETCPFSSFYTGAVPSNMNNGKHPIVQFAEDNVSFSINKDDSTVTQTTLDDEYRYLQDMGLTEAHIIRANFEALKHAFIDDNLKRELQLKLLASYGLLQSGTTCEIGEIKQLK